MVVQPERTDRIFRALGDATRRDIVMRVLGEEHSVSELSERYAMSFAAVQKHVAVLERAQLVTKHRSGRQVLVRGNVRTLRRATDLLNKMQRIWQSRFDQMEALVQQLEASEES